MKIFKYVAGFTFFGAIIGAVIRLIIIMFKSTGTGSIQNLMNFEIFANAIIYGASLFFLAALFVALMECVDEENNEG